MMHTGMRRRVFVVGPLGQFGVDHRPDGRDLFVSGEAGPLLDDLAVSCRRQFQTDRPDGVATVEL